MSDIHAGTGTDECLNCRNFDREWSSFSRMPELILPPPSDREIQWRKDAEEREKIWQHARQMMQEAYDRSVGDAKGAEQEVPAEPAKPGVRGPGIIAPGLNAKGGPTTPEPPTDFASITRDIARGS